MITQDRFEFPPSEIEFFVTSEDGTEKSVRIDVVEAMMVLDESAHEGMSDRDFVKKIGDWIREEYDVDLPFGHAWTLIVGIRASMNEFKKKLPSLVRSHLSMDLIPQPSAEEPSQPSPSA